MIKAFYPSNNHKIMHQGKSGNLYRLDAIEKPIRIKGKLLKDSNFEIIDVEKSDDSLLRTVHSKTLINSYKSGKPLSLAQSSGILWQKDFYPWVVNKSWVGVYACKEALSSGKAIAIQDGGHHAEIDSGFGFGPVNSLAIASKYLIKNKLASKVAILDLDVHYANGTHSLVKDEDKILSLDLWKYKYKLDKWNLTESSNNIYSKHVESLDEYFESLDILFNKIEKFQPDVLLYYLGLDVLETDRLKGIEGFNAEIFLKREELISQFINKLNLPICIFIGGGYIDYTKTASDAKIQMKRLIDLYYSSLKALLL